MRATGARAFPVTLAGRAWRSERPPSRSRASLRVGVRNKGSHQQSLKLIRNGRHPKSLSTAMGTENSIKEVGNTIRPWINFDVLFRVRDLT